jgi:superfamily II DNA or RNA helicase
MTITIASNAVVAKLINPDEKARQLVTEMLSYLVDGINPAFSTSGWDGRSSFFSRMTNTFPAGFVHLVHTQLTHAGYEVKRVRKPLPAPLGVENPIVDAFGNDAPRYDFQLMALRAVEKHGRGIIQVATGGGKSKIAMLIAARYRRMTMFLTTRGILMYQMKDGFAGAGFQVGVIGDSIFKPVKGINVGMVQTFIAKLKEPSVDVEKIACVAEQAKLLAKTGRLVDHKAAAIEAQRRFEVKDKERRRVIKLLELVEVVIGEEAHEAGGNSYFEILKYCKNAQIRVALTATPFMREAAEDNMRLMAAFGPVLIKVSEELLIGRGIMAKPYFKFIAPKPNPKLRKTSPWPRAVELEVVNGEARNQAIIDHATKAIGYGLPVIILVTRTKHGDILSKLLQEAGIKYRYIRGENDQDERKRALGLLQSGKINVLIGSTILDVGVDVPAIGMIILAGGGKAEVAHRQRIGRAAREKKVGANIFFVLDFCDLTNSFLKDHARARRAIVEDTPGFRDGILPANDDFPWHLLKNARI